jgi:hypothetical protein
MMSVEQLPNSAKEEMDEALAEVVKAAQKWRRCLTVELNGYGRYDVTATKYAEGAFRRAVADADAICADQVGLHGLLAPLVDADGPALTRRS